MQDRDNVMDAWCIEKATDAVVMLAYAVNAINRLPERPMEDDNGVLTEDWMLISSVIVSSRSAGRMVLKLNTSCI